MRGASSLVRGGRRPRASPGQTGFDASCYPAPVFQGNHVLKILLLIAIGFIVFAIFKAYQRSLQNARPPVRESDAVENMVKCAHCGVNLPRSEAIYSGGDFYCTPEHKQLGKK
jgi:uncharacterized protein